MLLLSFSAIAEEFDVNPGILPDSPFYAVDQAIENILVGDNPERALAYREEKLAEAQAMAGKQQTGDAQKALERASSYGDILEKEITPEMEEFAKGRSALAEGVLEGLAKDLPALDVVEHLEQQKRIALAGEVSSKIKELCEALSSLDPKQYAETCRTSDDSPAWFRSQDRKLTKEQEAHVKVFREKLQECFETSGVRCDCKGMGVKSFEQLCLEESSKAARCFENDNYDECDEDDDIDFEDYLPDYLLPIMMEMEQREGGMPPECRKAGATSPRECQKIMMELHMPEECKEAGATTEKECRDIMMPEECKEAGATTEKECRAIMMPDECKDAGATTEKECRLIMMPEECKEAGITSEKECRKLMMPEECKDAGINSESECRKLMKKLELENMPEECKEAGAKSGRDCQKIMEAQWKENRPEECAGIDNPRECEKIMREQHREGPPARIQEFGRDCHAVQDLEEKLRCFESFYNDARQEGPSEDERFREEQRGPEGEFRREFREEDGRFREEQRGPEGEFRREFREEDGRFREEQRGPDGEFRREFRDENGEFREEFHEEDGQFEEEHREEQPPQEQQQEEPREEQRDEPQEESHQDSSSSDSGGSEDSGSGGESSSSSDDSSDSGSGDSGNEITGSAVFDFSRFWRAFIG